MKRKCNVILGVATMLCLATSLPALAQGRARGFGAGAAAQATGQAAHLVALNRALQVAGASALSSAQESSINTLIANFRASHTPPAPNTSLQTARAAYNNAILSGQYDAASANIIVQDMAANAATRLQDQATFTISVLQVLDKEGQVDLLVKQFGANRVVQLLQMLPGGPGAGRGRGAMGMGMGRSAIR